MLVKCLNIFSARDSKQIGDEFAGDGNMMWLNNDHLKYWAVDSLSDNMRHLH